MSSVTNDEELDKIRSQFNKKFRFQCPATEKWQLSDFVRAQSAYDLHEFQLMKDNLNEVKSKLNELSIEIWSEHTKNMNPAGEIVWRVRNETKGEFVTQAWCKLYECLYSYDLVPKDVRTFNSLHLCEAPGAFVTALNHFLQLNHPDGDWKWIATTLNPYYEGNCLENMIIDDRFIVQTLHRWDFGADYTGNIMSFENIEHLKEKCQEMKGINFVTADGSIDCMLQPEDQERHVASLHYAETVVALQVLSPGGNFLLKMFTFFEDSSISLIYLLNTVFDSVDIYKPSTSKEGNSEVYVICQGFQPIPALTKYVEAIIGSNFDTNYGLFVKETIPDSFLQQLADCCRLFMSIQVDVIERNLRTFEKLSKKEIFHIKSLRHKILEEFYDKYQLKPIPADKKILTKKSECPKMNLNPRQHVGSYVERKHRNSMCEEERYLTLQNRLQTFVMEFFNFEGAINFRITPKKGGEHLQPLTPYYGKTIHTLTSSKFVYTPKLRLFLEIVSLIKNSPKRPKSFGAPSIQSSNQTGVVIQIDPLSFVAASAYDTYEKELALELIETVLSSLEDQQNIVIQNLLLLSQFLSGIIFYIGHTFFENLFFYKEGAIVLSNYQRSEINQSGLQSLKNLIRNDSRVNNGTNDQTIVGIVDLKTLFVRQSFYEAVVQYNTSLVLQYSMKYLKFYDENCR